MQEWAGPALDGWMAGMRNNMLQGKSERRYKYTEGMKQSEAG